MQATLNHILNNFTAATAIPLDQSPLANYIRNTASSNLIQQASLPSDKYLVKGSPGMGNWAEVPWISVFDKDISRSATKGYYVVYLFAADMSGVFLSLNQGWTYYKESFGTVKGKVNAQKVVNTWREVLNSALGEFTTYIDLKCHNNLGKGYENAHICGKYYAAGNIPDNVTLINDLRNLLGVFRELKGLMGNRSFEQVNEYIINNNQLDIAPIEEEDETAYQESVIHSPATETPETPQAKPNPVVDRRGATRWPRNPNVAKEALIKSNYLCEIDNRHMTFTSNTTGTNFVEAHHLIPIKYQHDFDHNLDVPGNIVSLCPNCHKAIHHATPSQKQLLIEHLYNAREARLSLFGVPITLERLFELY